MDPRVNEITPIAVSPWSCHLPMLVMGTGLTVIIGIMILAVVSARSGGWAATPPRYNKMVIIVDVNTGAVEKVQRRGGGPDQDINKSADQPKGTSIGTLVKYTGSNCVTLNLPGGGSYKLCT